MSQSFNCFLKVASTVQERTIHVGTRAMISRLPARDAQAALISAGRDAIGCNNFASWIFSSMHHNMIMCLQRRMQQNRKILF